MFRKTASYLFQIVSLLGLGLLAPAQERVMGGPSPEVRGHIDAFIKAFNSGSAEQWEKMAQAHFSPTLLKRRTPEERKQVFEKLGRDLGKLSVGQVNRQGPNAPLELHVDGSTGMKAVIEIDLEPASPYLISGVQMKVGGDDDDEKKLKVPLPAINGRMSSEQLTAALDPYFSKLTADDVFSGNVLIAKDGKPMFEQSYGYADRANKLPNNSTTRFNLGSINKTFTQSAIQQLVARGKLSLDDTVGKLLPDYPQEVTRSATVKQLLEHTAGVADFFGERFADSNKDQFRSNADYYKLVSSLKPLFAPGSRKQYCNGCYIVLGAIIERVSGMPYEKYVEENIFKPLGMGSTAPLQVDALVPNVAMGYTHRGRDEKLHSNIYMRGAAGSAAGGGYSTTADLMAYAQALYHGRVPDAPAADGFGIAGGSPGCNSIVDEEGPWTIVVLTNMDPQTGEQIGSALAQALSRPEGK